MCGKCWNRSGFDPGASENYSGYAELDNIARKVKETEEQLGRTEDDLEEAHNNS